MPGPRYQLKVWDDAAEAWVSSVPRTWDENGGWVVPAGDYTFAYRTPFFPDYLGEGSVLQRSVADMPLHTNSVEQAQWMADNVNYGDGFGPTSLNSSLWGTHPIACYVIDSTIGPTDTAVMDCGGHGADGGYGEAVLSGVVPWPRWIGAGSLQFGQDSSIVFYDIGTGLLREYYQVTPVDGYVNKFTALVGGYRLYPRRQTRLGDIDYALQLTKGTNSVVGMSNHLGWIDINSARLGVINHAVAFTCANMATPTSVGEAIRQDGTRYQYQGASWPATGGDGDSVPTDDEIPIHGQWARLPPDYDTSGFKPFLRMVLEAVKTYGMFCSDSNNFVHAFNVEPGFTEAHFMGIDPWEGDIADKWEALNDAEGFTGDAITMADFPWADTEWAPRNWGKPE